MLFKNSTSLRNFVIFAPMILLCASLISATSKKPEEFKEGFKALDREEWVEAASLLRQALAESPEEDGQRTRIYGSRYERYYPYYYLGMALYNLGCYKEALEQFEASLRGGVLRGRELDDLLTLQDKSQELLREEGQKFDTNPCSAATSDKDRGE